MGDYSESKQQSRDRNGLSGDDLESSGQAILKLLHKAADTAEANGRRASETAQQMANRLEAVRGRITELEGHLEFYQGTAERAEEWLHKIGSEIEARLMRDQRTDDDGLRGDHEALSSSR